MRFVVYAQVRTENGVVWLRRVLDAPVAAASGVFLRFPGVPLTLQRDMRDPGGGVRMICEPVNGAHFANRLREYEFSFCDPPE